jgi:apolipoprotein N-acyltransferase
LTGLFGRLAGLAARIAAIAGWRGYGLGFGLGAMATLAFSPIYAVPVLFPAFTGFLWLLDGSQHRTRPGRSAFAIGWWFGLGHFVFGMYWIAFALLTDSERYWWLVPFCVLGIPAVLALFTAAVAWLTYRARFGGVAQVLWFACMWTLFEWLRGTILSGFPWNLVGYAWSGWPEMLQLAAFTGVYGLSLWTMIAAAMPAVLSAADAKGRLPRPGALGLVAAILLPVVVWGIGVVRLADRPAAGHANVEGVRLRLVQPNINQAHKWRSDLREANVRALLDLTGRQGLDGITHVIWPETAVPYVLANEPILRRIIAAAAPPHGLVITGTVRTTSQVGVPFQVWNSLQALDSSGTIVGSYDKFHLVPFGEYVPLRRFLPINKITSGGTDFSAGPGPQSIVLPGLPPVSPLICYEVIFPGEVTDRRDRPAWLLNVTNDAWYGKTAGPHQHFAIARVRAVEEGVPLVRSANTGISGVIDPYGRVVGQLALGTKGVLDVELPLALPASTIYARFGNWIALAIGAAIAIAAYLCGRRSAPIRP